MALFTAQLFNGVYEAFNPIEVEITATTEADGEELLCVVGINGSYFSLYRSAIDGAATFDLSRIFTQGFKESEEIIYTHPIGVDIIEDYRLFINGAVTCTSTSGSQPNIAVLNAVRQWGEATYFQDSANPALNKECVATLDQSSTTWNCQIKKYQNYPLRLAFFNVADPSLVVSTSNNSWIGNSTQTFTRSNGSIARFFAVDIDQLSSDSLVVGTHQIVTISIVDTCVPENPYYIRWINDIGGWEYNMFSYNRQHSFSLADRVNIQRPQGSATSQSMVSATPTQSITIVEEGLSYAEFVRLSGIVVAPIVEHYNEDTGEWESLLVGEDTSVVYEPSTTQQSITIELIEPRPLLQF